MTSPVYSEHFQNHCTVHFPSSSFFKTIYFYRNFRWGACWLFFWAFILLWAARPGDFHGDKHRQKCCNAAKALLRKQKTMFIVKGTNRKLEMKYLKFKWFHCMAVTHSQVSHDALASACKRWWGWTLGQHRANLCKTGSPWDEGNDRRAWLSLKRTSGQWVFSSGRLTAGCAQ